MNGLKFSLWEYTYHIINLITFPLFCTKSLSFEHLHNAQSSTRITDNAKKMIATRSWSYWAVIRNKHLYIINCSLQYSFMATLNRLSQSTENIESMTIWVRERILINWNFLFRKVCFDKKNEINVFGKNYKMSDISLLEIF